MATRALEALQPPQLQAAHLALNQNPAPGGKVPEGRPGDGGAASKSGIALVELEEKLEARPDRLMVGCGRESSENSIG